MKNYSGNISMEKTDEGELTGLVEELRIAIPRTDEEFTDAPDDISINELQIVVKIPADETFPCRKLKWPRRIEIYQDDKPYRDSFWIWEHPESSLPVFSARSLMTLIGETSPEFIHLLNRTILSYGAVHGTSDDAMYNMTLVPVRKLDAEKDTWEYVPAIAAGSEFCQGLMNECPGYDLQARAIVQALAWVCKH